jgi:hypothetical protein
MTISNIQNVRNSSKFGELLKRFDLKSLKILKLWLFENIGPLVEIWYGTREDYRKEDYIENYIIGAQ